MKKIITLFILLAPLLSQAQVSNWYNVDIGRLGYRHNTFRFENARNGEAHLWKGDPFREIKGGSWELSVEIYGKHVFFGFNGSFLMDAGTVLFSFSDKERWWKNSKYDIQRAEMVPTQLAFGFPIGQYFALYAGGQYQWTAFSLRYYDQSDIRRPVFITGNQRGAGIHGIFAWRFINVRYSYMHDWMLAAKTYKGMAYTHELALHFGSKEAGLFLKFNHVHREMLGGWLPADRNVINKDDLSDTYAYLPGEVAQQFSFSIGVFAQGLFSGVTQAGSYMISETEKGIRKERNEKKKRGIEWVE